MGQMGALMVLAISLLLLAVSHSVFSEERSVASESESESKSEKSDASLPPDTFRKLAQALYQRGEKAENRLQRKFFYNESVTCNDGSVAGFYLRRNYRSNRWIIFLEGGWICHDESSCRRRGARQPRLLSSDRWPSVRTVGGVLSSDPKENPHFHEANHVFVPYCSSDAWSGTRAGNGAREERRTTAFMGSLIVEQVIRELADFEQLLYGDELFLAGSSAGATGVLINVDHVADMVAATGLRVRGIVDSGWFLDTVPYEEKEESEGGVSVVRDVKRGIISWHPRLPEVCTRRLERAEVWQCFLGYKVFPMIQSPLFIFQWQFDSFQMYAANLASPSSRHHWNYIHKLGADLRSSLNNVSAVFAPACIAHEVITKSEWTKVQVDDVALPDALHCWASSLSDVKEGRGQQDGVQRHLPSPLLANLGQRDEIFAHNDEDDEEKNHSSSSSMQMDSPSMSERPSTSFLASNLVRSIRQPPSSSNSRNSISHRFGRRRGRHGRRGRHDRRGRHRGDRGRDNRRVLSNATDQLVDDDHDHDGHDEDGSGESLGDRHRYGRPPRRRKNADLVRSLDRRSSRHSKSSMEANRTKERLSSKEERRRRRRERQRLRRARKMRRRRERRLRRRKQGRKRRQRTGEGKQKRRAELQRPRRSQQSMKKSHHIVVRSASAQEKQTSCQLRLIDRCTWPHCNRSCPKLKNPETGQEIDFLALLRSFGLNMGSVADALGVDMATLNRMDREVLVHMLTSHASSAVDLSQE